VFKKNKFFFRNFEKNYFDFIYNYEPDYINIYAAKNNIE